MLRNQGPRFAIFLGILNGCHANLAAVDTNLRDIVIIIFETLPLPFWKCFSPPPTRDPLVKKYDLPGAQLIFLSFSYSILGLILKVASRFDLRPGMQVTI